MEAATGAAAAGGRGDQADARTEAVGAAEISAKQEGNAQWTCRPAATMAMKIGM